MNDEFGPALKLFLDYPMEMDFWYVHSESEEESIMDLAKEICKTDEDPEKFISDAVLTYKAAFASYHASVIVPLWEKVISLQSNKVHFSQRQLALNLIGEDRQYFDGYFERNIRIGNNKNVVGTIGLYGEISRSNETNDGLNESSFKIHPRFWFRNRRLRDQFIQGESSEFSTVNSTLAVFNKPIVVKSNSSPSDIVNKIFEPLKKAFPNFINVISP